MVPYQPGGATPTGGLDQRRKIGKGRTRFVLPSIDLPRGQKFPTDINEPFEIKGSEWLGHFNLTEFAKVNAKLMLLMHQDANAVMNFTRVLCGTNHLGKCVLFDRISQNSLERIIRVYVHQALLDPDSAGKLLKQFGAQLDYLTAQCWDDDIVRPVGDPRTPGVTQDGNFDFRLVLPGESYFLLHSLENNREAQSRIRDWPTHHWGRVSSAASMSRALHMATEGTQREALVKFLGAITSEGPELPDNLWLLWYQASNRLAMKWRDNEHRIASNPHFSVATTATFDTSRSEGGKVGELRSRALIFMKGKTLKDMGIRPSRLEILGDFFGRPVLPGRYEDYGEISENELCENIFYRQPIDYLFGGFVGEDTPNTGDLILLWAVATARKRFNRSGSEPIHPDCPLWDVGECEHWTAEDGAIESRVFVLAEEGIKARPANTPPLDIQIISQVLRTWKEGYIFTDFRVQKGIPSMWDLHLRLNDPAKNKGSIGNLRSLHSRHGQIEAMSLDLSQASDLLHPKLLQAQSLGFGNMFSDRHFYNRCYNAVALSNREIYVEGLDKSTPFAIQKRGTLLGDPTSFLELQTYLLVAIDIADALAASPWSIGLAPPLAEKITDTADPTSYNALGLLHSGDITLPTSLPERHEHSEAQVCGDDGVRLGSKFGNRLLEHVIAMTGGKVNEKTLFSSFLIKFIEERMFKELNPPTTEGAGAYIDTMKLRFYNRGTSGRDRQCPLFGKIYSIGARLRYMIAEGHPDGKAYLRLAWTAFPEIVSMIARYPITLDARLGGIGMPSLGLWPSKASQLTQRTRTVLLEGMRNQQIRAMLGTVFFIEKHGAKALGSAQLDEIMSVGVGVDAILEEMNRVIPEGYTAPLTGSGKIFVRNLCRDVGRHLGAVYLSLFDLVKAVTRAKAFREFLFTDREPDVPMVTLAGWRQQWDRIYAATESSPYNRPKMSSSENLSHFLITFPRENSAENELRQLGELKWFPRTDPLIVAALQGPTLAMQRSHIGAPWSMTKVIKKRSGLRPRRDSWSVYLQKVDELIMASESELANSASEAEVAPGAVRPT